MSELINSFVAAIDARISYENDKSTMQADSYAMLSKASKLYNSTLIASLIVSAELSADFINAQESADKRFCVKAIDRSTDYIKFASESASFIKTANARTVLETAINLLLIDENMTRNDANASCTSKQDKAIAIDKAREMHISRRDTIASAAKRQASMSLKALCALDILNEVQKDVFALNTENIVTQKILARYAA